MAFQSVTSLDKTYSQAQAADGGGAPLIDIQTQTPVQSPRIISLEESGSLPQKPASPDMPFWGYAIIGAAIGALAAKTLLRKKS